MSSGTDQSEDIRNEVARIKRMLGLDVNRLAIGSDIEGIIDDASRYPWGVIDFTILGVSTISNVNVSTSIGPSQTNAPGVPPQTTGLTVTVIGDTQLNLVWNASIASDHVNYKVYRSATSGFTPGAANLIASPVSNSYNNTGLTPGTTYYYKVSDLATFEGPVSTQVSGTTTGVAPTPPPQVTGLNVTVAGSTQLNLVWTASSDPSLLNYNIYRSTTSGAEVLITTSVTNSYSDISVSPGTTYYYKVAAVNSVGAGTLSVEDSATTSGSPTPINPNAWFGFDFSDSDSSGNANTIVNTNEQTLDVSPGAFGTACRRYNETMPTDVNNPAFSRLLNNANVQMDTTVGFSVSFWVRPFILGNTQIGNNPAVILSKKDSTGQEWSFQIDTSGNGIFFVYANGSSLCVKGAGFTTGTFQHVGITYNAASDTRLIYRNGVLLSTTVASPMPCTSTDLTIGKSDQNISQAFYRGRVDELQYFKGRVLNSTQINNLKNSNQTS